MLSTKLVRPAAAGFLPIMISTLKCSSAMNGRTSFQLTCGTRPASYSSLSSLRSATSCGMLPRSTFLQVPQSRFFSRTLPDFSAGMSLPVGVWQPAMSTITEANTSSTPGGGFIIDLQLPSALISRVSRAAMAASTAGSAAARSASADAACAVTSVWIWATLAASMLAFSVSISTTSFSAWTVVAMPFAMAAFSPACSSLMATSALSESTIEAHSLSFWIPLSRRACATSFFPRVSESSFL
mmetsp:Transcript_4420/g.9331  ORF Transcript_4420/g.9331 Transcript_4420/m.9331 type:complete len:241 (-) Transcript_4420:7817-8539(-)